MSAFKERVKERAGLAAAALYPRAIFRTLGDPDRQLLNERERDLALGLAEHWRIRVVSAVCLSLASPKLSEKERFGTFLFISFVTHADDFLDEEVLSGVREKAKLGVSLLKKEITIGSETRTLGWLYGETLDHFPPPKQKVIKEFFSRMGDLHAEGEHKGEAGKYGYKEALAYKSSVIYACLEAALNLIDGNFSQQDSLLAVLNAVSMIDDAVDYMADFKGNRKNLYLGMARDVWEEGRRPSGKDLDWIRTVAAQPVFTKGARGKIEAIRTMRRPEMRDTRAAYRKAFSSELEKKGDFPFKRDLEILGDLIL